MNSSNQASQILWFHTTQLWVADLATSDLGNTASVLHKFCVELPPALPPRSPWHNPVMRGQGWPAEGTCDGEGTANSFLAVNQGKAPTSFLYKMSHWPMRGCMGWLRAALKKDKVFIQPRILPKHSLLSGLDPKGLKEVPAWSFETVVSWISFRQSIGAVTACSLGVHAVNHWNVRSERSSR